MTDLRVRLHKKMKMKEMAGGGGEQPAALLLPSHPPPPPQLELLSQSAKQRLKRTLEQGFQPEEEEEVEDFEEILGPLEPSKKRKVVPPGSRLEFCVEFATNLGFGFAVNSTCTVLCGYGSSPRTPTERQTVSQKSFRKAPKFCN